MNRSGAMINIPFQGAVKYLILTNVAIYLVLQIVVDKMILDGSGAISHYLGLIPISVISNGYIWQIFTYQFLHSLDPLHLLFNMLILWMFGTELEQRWGSRFFVRYYLVCGVGAGLIYTLGYALYALATGSMSHLVIPVVGASGAVFGVMLAYGILFSERTMYFMMLFPLKAKYFVMLIAGLELMWMLTGTQAGAANLAHLGGIITGFLVLQFIARKKASQRGKKPKGKAGPALKLVVDNEKSNNDGPKYWN